MENHASELWNDLDSLAGKFPHFLLQIGLGPDLMYCQLWWILASCPCPRILNSGSIHLKYIFLTSLPADTEAIKVWNPPSYTSRPLFHVHFTLLVAESLGGVRCAYLLLSWERNVFPITFIHTLQPKGYELSKFYLLWRFKNTNQAA